MKREEDEEEELDDDCCTEDEKQRDRKRFSHLLPSRSTAEVEAKAAADLLKKTASHRRFRFTLPLISPLSQ